MEHTQNEQGSKTRYMQKPRFKMLHGWRENMAWGKLSRATYQVLQEEAGVEDK